MATFLVGLVILLVGGYLYGVFVERIFKPDDRKTPAVQMEDGIDYVPMSKWKNALINLLNIAGSGHRSFPSELFCYTGNHSFITF